MSWLKIDDQIPRHPKVLRVTPSAAWLWVCSIAYAQSQLTDGFIPDGAIGSLGRFKHSLKGSLKQLCAARLLDRVEGGYQVHDYLKYNASAKQRRRELRQRVDAGRRGGKSTQARVRKALKHQAPAKGSAQASTQAGAQAKRKRPAQPLSTPLHSTPYIEAGAPAARPADRTNTGGNGADHPRRDAQDAPSSAPSAPVARRSALTPAQRKHFGLDE